MRSNRLQPNPDKTEVLWCTTSRCQHQLPTCKPTCPLVIDGCSVYPAASARDLGVYVDCDLSMRAHVARTTLRCFASLRQLRQIRHSVPTATFQMLIVAMVHSRLDYGNAVLAGLPAYLLRRLQSVLNASARLIYRLGFRDHITDALISLHWLRVRERVEFKLATLTYKLLHSQAPSYLGPLVPVVDVPGRRPLRSANTDCLMVPHVRLSSVGNRAFPVAAPRVWNSLSYKVTSAQRLYSFQQHLKTFLFQRFFPDVIVTL